MHMNSSYAHGLKPMGNQIISAVPFFFFLTQVFKAISLITINMLL